MSQVKSVSSTQHHDTSTWGVTAAPGSEEIIWGNVRCAAPYTPSPSRATPVPVVAAQAPTFTAAS